MAGKRITKKRRKGISGKPLSLARLKNGLPALTPILGQSLIEACSVCLNQHNHSNPVSLKVNGLAENKFQLKYQKVTDQMQRAYADLTIATEHAAEAIAIAIVTQETEFTIITRAMKKTGIDYWLGRKNDNGGLFQNKARLEVSGIFSGDENAINTRLRKKELQVKQSNDSGLPVYIVISEFSGPTTSIKANGI